MIATSDRQIGLLFGKFWELKIKTDGPTFLIPENKDTTEVISFYLGKTYIYNFIIFSCFNEIFKTQYPVIYSTSTNNCTRLLYSTTALGHFYEYSVTQKPRDEPMLVFKYNSGESPFLYYSRHGKM